MVPDSLSVTNLVEQQQRCTLIHVVCMPFSLVLTVREREQTTRDVAGEAAPALAAKRLVKPR